MSTITFWPVLQKLSVLISSWASLLLSSRFWRSSSFNSNRIGSFLTSTHTLFYNCDVHNCPMWCLLCLNPIQSEGGEKPKKHPTNFSPVTSTNVGISPQNFLTFSYNPFATIMLNFKAITSASPELLNFNQDHPSKKVLSLVKSLQNRGYDNFSHKSARIAKLWLHEQICNIIWVMW